MSRWETQVIAAKEEALALMGERNELKKELKELREMVDEEAATNKATLEVLRDVRMAHA